ncbi:MAG TPA: TadE family protein [Candidatus Limnocylindrales bacterium]|nr:TadE family protein [Candidatus Limnocylindrales bacterium]
MASTPTPEIDDAPARPASALARVARAAVPAVLRRRLGGSRKGLGQSLAEFAITLPLALFMVLFGLDFGRVFLGWVSLNQAAREAANYAAMNPTAWTVPYDLGVLSEYSRLVQTETGELNCDLASVPAPTFSSGTSIAAPAKVTLTCSFHLITPIISNILGNSILVSASSAFPIRTGTIEGIPIASTAPTASPAPTPTGGTPTATPGPTPSPGASATTAPSGSAAPTPTGTATPSATPAQCHVISLLGTKTNKAAAKWKAAGFTGGVIFSPLVPPTYTIAWQSLTVSGTTTVDCSTSITVRSNAP